MMRSIVSLDGTIKPLAVLIAPASALAAMVSGAAIAFNPILALGAFAVIAFSVLIIRSPAIAVALWTVSFFVPFAPLGNALLKAGFALIPVALIFRSLKRSRATSSPLLPYANQVVFVAGFLCWAAASVLWAADPAVSVAALGVWLLPITIFVLVLVTFTTEQDVKILVTSLVLGASLAGLTAMIETNGGTGPSVLLADRSGGAAGDPNILATGLVAGLALIVGLVAAAARSPHRNFLFIGLVASGALAIIGLVGSASRGAAVAAVVAVVAGIFVSRHRVRGAVLAAGSTTFLALFWATLSPNSWERVTDFSGGGTGRSELWRAALELWFRHPLKGVGVGNLVTAEPGVALDIGELRHADLIAETPLVAHNMVLQLLSELGLVGLSIYAGIWFISMRSVLDAASAFERCGRTDLAHLARGVAVALIAMLAAGMFLSLGHEYRVWTLLALGPVLKRLADDMPLNSAARPRRYPLTLASPRVRG